MGNKERSQKKINAFFGISMVDLVMLIPKTSNSLLIFQNLGQRKKSKKSIKKSIKKCLKMDGGKKRIPRAEFHGIFLNFVECGIAYESGKSVFLPNKRNSNFNSTEFRLSRVEILLFRQ